MSVKSMLAARTKKKLRFAILRPRDQDKVKPFVTGLEERIKEGLPSEQFQQQTHEMLQPSCVFMGFAKNRCMLIFDENGYPTGKSIQPGDVMDEIEDFKRACESGAYQKTGENIDL
jgi:hypothetical protein